MVEAPTTRLADVLGALSSATDLAAGVPMETSLRACMLATAFGAALQLSEGERADVYYGALLRHLGCTSLSREAASEAAGDDHAWQRETEAVDFSQTSASLRDRADAAHRTVCDQAVALATDLGMSSGVARALGEMHERFDGGGALALKGDAIGVGARIVHLTTIVVTMHRQGGRQRAIDEVRRRRGAEVAADVCHPFLADPDSFWPLLEGASRWDAYLDAEPGVPESISEARLDAVVLAFARYADLKAAAMLGHSPGVASLSVAAARIEGLEPEATHELWRAALVHDLGIVSVPNGILEKPAALTSSERERMHLHAYYTNLVLEHVPALKGVRRIASLHHERCDASGYFRGVAPVASDRAARILASADAHRALTEDRPYRAASSAEEARRTLQKEASEGRLCKRAVESVLVATGLAPRVEATPPAGRPLPSGLTAREAEVLVHVARGLTSKEVATALGITARTVEHHLENIYAKIGVTTRAAAALFAVRNELL